MAKYFYFTRHGQTVWNVENKICGATDSPLTEHGRQQAAETGKNIVESGIKADEILYSPLSRAADTAFAVWAVFRLRAHGEAMPCSVPPCPAIRKRSRYPSAPSYFTSVWGNSQRSTS